MGRLCVTTLDDTVQCVAKLKHAIWQRFSFDCRLEQRSASMLIFQMSETYNWTEEDAKFMNNLTDQQDWIAGWRYWPLDVSQTERTRRMIHKLDNGFAISSNGVWLPGCYNSERAAKYAFKFSDEELRLLQNEVNAKEHDIAKRVISFEMLQELKKSMEG